MFRALDRLSGDSVISLDSRWDHGVGLLRRRCRDDEILCPECQQPVRLRAGSIRRRHFAHLSRSDCPLARESVEVLAARAMLYRLLQRIFGDKVSVEEPIPGKVNERADVVVTLDDHKAAYFIVPRQITRDRDAFVKSREKAYQYVHWILLPRLLKKAPKKDNEFLLSTTARDLASCAGAEALYPVKHDLKLGSLCYLYHKHDRLVLLRGLRCVHGPNVFRMKSGLKLPPEEVTADTDTGQLMSAREWTDLVEWRNAEDVRRQEAERQRVEAAAREQERQARVAAELAAQRQAAITAMKAAAEQARATREARAVAWQTRHARVAESSHEAAYGQRTVNTPFPAREERTLVCHVCKKRVAKWVYEQFDGCLCWDCNRVDRSNLQQGAKPAVASTNADVTERHRKELRCLHCGQRTRQWVQHAYSSEHPDGICLCSKCHAAGKEFPCVDGSG